MLIERDWSVKIKTQDERILKYLLNVFNASSFEEVLEF